MKTEPTSVAIMATTTSPQSLPSALASATNTISPRYITPLLERIGFR